MYAYFHFHQKLPSLWAISVILGKAREMGYRTSTLLLRPFLYCPSTTCTVYLTPLIGNALKINKNSGIFPIDEASAFCFAYERRMERRPTNIIRGLHILPILLVLSCSYRFTYDSRTRLLLVHYRRKNMLNSKRKVTIKKSSI